MAQLKHFMHEHSLSLIEVDEDDNACCALCFDIVYGPAYACTTCRDDSVMHKSCAELPPQIQRDALHPHPLRYQMINVIVCDRYGRMSANFISFKCTRCLFNLDFKCAIAFFNDDELANHEELQGGRRIKTTIHHFSRNHPLTRSKFLLPTTKLGIEIFEELWKSGQTKCLACKQELQGTLIYACLHCEFVLHESCINDMPRQVQSPFHPQHILLPRAIRKGSFHRCCACREAVKGISFSCDECDVNLNVSCAKDHTRTIKHNCHPHNLLHLGKSITTKITCHACPKNFGDSFICIECDFCIHVECISLPPRVEHKRHLHPLELINSFVEDDSEDYYCDMCETERNPEHHFYYCKECTYIAHIDYAVSEIKPAGEMFLDRRQIEENSDKRLEPEMESDNEKLNHYSHRHSLSLVEVGEDDKACCVLCLDINYGSGYACTTCRNFVLHKSCAELAPLIQRDALHPHPLRSQMINVIVCDRCGRMSANFISFKCTRCLFNLDFKCAIAFFNDDELANHEALREGRRIKTTIHHFSHNHPLTRSKFLLPTTKFGIEIFEGLWKSGQTKCLACKQELQGTVIYACLHCEFVVHESCINDMPRQVQSPFHPQHILFPRAIREGSFHRCCACRKKVKGISFYCNECDVNLHVSCAKYHTRTIKHNCHPHNLLHLGKSIATKISCHACCKNFGDSFICIECDFCIHVECISLPPRVEHKRHLHPLELINSFVEDDSEDYYCDMCETERNPEHHFYYCEECVYIAHIDCVVSEIKPAEEMFLDRQQIEENSDKRLELEMESDYEKRIQKDVFHPHPLTLNKDIETAFVCNGCGELCRGLSYNCDLCLFSLDIKCATLNDDQAKHEVKRGRDIKVSISHFSHEHQLNRCEINTLRNEPERSCMACKQGACGLMYVCLICGFILHESCLQDKPWDVQSHFHPEHLFQPFSGPVDNDGKCDACNECLKGIWFVCFECNIAMHCSCAMYQTREINHDCHKHRLLHLGKNIFVERSPKCGACGADCSNTLFGCIECKFYRHLECIQLPYIVKHIRHLHPLTLTNSVVEDNSGKYYCDICETERNPEHDVYYCEECNYIAHIDCVISEVEPPEKIFEYLIPRLREEEAEE